jgi:hypothetical protein
LEHSLELSFLYQVIPVLIARSERLSPLKSKRWTRWSGSSRLVNSFSSTWGGSRSVAMPTLRCAPHSNPAPIRSVSRVYSKLGVEPLAGWRYMTSSRPSPLRSARIVLVVVEEMGGDNAAIRLLPALNARTPALVGRPLDGYSTQFPFGMATKRSSRPSPS